SESVEAWGTAGVVRSAARGHHRRGVSTRVILDGTKWVTGCSPSNSTPYRGQPRSLPRRRFRRVARPEAATGVPPDPARATKSPVHPALTARVEDPKDVVAPRGGEVARDADVRPADRRAGGDPQPAADAVARTPALSGEPSRGQVADDAGMVEAGGP